MERIERIKIMIWALIVVILFLFALWYVSKPSENLLPNIYVEENTNEEDELDCTVYTNLTCYNSQSDFNGIEIEFCICKNNS